MPQHNLQEYWQRQAARDLTERERRVLLLIRDSLPASRIANATGFPRSSVAAIITRLEEKGLISKKKGLKYNILYDLSEEAEKQLSDENAPKLSPFRVHRIGMVFKILQRSGEYSRDPRISSLQGSYKPRGGLRLTYTFFGKNGDPDFTVTVWGKTLMIQMDKLNKIQRVGGFTVDDAIFRAYQYCIAVKDRFVEVQGRFGCRIRLESAGRTILKEHASIFANVGGKAAEGGVTVPGWIIDNSGKKVRPDLVEVENVQGYMNSIETIRPIDDLLRNANRMPEIIREALDPLQANIQKVEAMVNGGTTAQQTVVKLMGLIGQMLTTMNEQKREIGELRDILTKEGKPREKYFRSIKRE